MFDGEVRGLLETQRELERVAAELHGEPMVQAFRDATLILTRDAKKESPVDVGRLRSSITPEVRTRGMNVEGVTGTNVKYGPYMETGTKPHWPPRGALETWARRHGVSEFVVRRAIARKGTRARRYFQAAFEKNEDEIKRMIDGAVGKIVSK